jgi:hypothetical protein
MTYAMPMPPSCDLGINSKIVTDRLGHANVAVTQQIDTHPSTGQDRATAEMIAEFIAEALATDRTSSDAYRVPVLNDS